MTSKNTEWKISRRDFLKTSGIAGATMILTPVLTGRNVLAGSAHNDSPGSSDLTLIVQLKVDGNIVIDEGSSIKVIQPLQNTPVLKPKELPLNSSLGVFGNLSVYTRN